MDSFLENLPGSGAIGGEPPSGAELIEGAAERVDNFIGGKRRRVYRKKTQKKGKKHYKKSHKKRGKSHKKRGKSRRRR